MYSALVYVCRSQWPRGLRRTSASVRLLILWVRIPPGAWMSLCCAVCFQVEISLTGWSLVHRGVLPTVMRCCVWSRNLVNEEAMAYWGGGGAIGTKYIQRLCLAVIGCHCYGFYKVVIIHVRLYFGPYRGKSWVRVTRLLPQPLHIYKIYKIYTLKH